MKNKPNSFIEHTNLRTDLMEKDIDTLIEQAKMHSFFGVCVPPFWVKKTKRDLSGCDIKVVTVIGFPLGYQQTNIKLAEIETAIEDGADELDVVLNVSAFKSGMSWVKIELAKCVGFAHQHNKILKVIVETALLNEEELIAISKIVSDAGADFIKTSTGFSTRGATVRDVELMKANIAESVGIKASGGIRSLADLNALVGAGAERIGASSGVDIMKEYSGE